MKHGKAASEELERCIKELGMVGALIDSHLDDGRYYDEVALDVFAKAQELDVPIYIHPTTPLEDVQVALYDGNYDKEVGAVLGIAGWDWHCDTALSVLRMYAAGRVELQANLSKEHLSNHEWDVYNATDGVFAKEHEYRQDNGEASRKWSGYRRGILQDFI
ncbi:hypothetical protein TRIATDRAFT_281365 [Trichoderma atroviride IMI 206040]|uniref:Amidohydrolase-related domain-containing protein n=1 Tax=Hypocrea atroviridis (strain ATCC 20476 / IMI 206040) TaxID=452589 RepID=G9NKT3_HYPAI|nr:uncharacterized protein TRIATDRAFT_281365 [Trichoderma atroviride IMI 206040]EHK48505.1 hypothetical protein TRIATDRAFT_281365 [Trichoderma atroviride IMI 206040]